MWALKFLIILVVAYAAVVLIAYSAQTSLLFPTSLAGRPPILAPNSERIMCDTLDGERLQGVRIPPATDSRGDRMIVLGFGGNAWNAENMASYLHELFPTTEVITFHYRGYRPSTGTPGAAALLSDAPLVYDCAIRTGDPARLVVVGFSIGTGVAAHLARRRPVGGLVLVTPFDTLERLARQHYRWLPIGLLLRHHMAPVDELRDVTAPVALIAAEEDTIIPEQRTAPLRMAARDLILDQTIACAGHNDLYADPEFVRAMRQAMKLIADRADAGSAQRLPAALD